MTDVSVMSRNELLTHLKLLGAKHQWKDRFGIAKTITVRNRSTKKRAESLCCSPLFLSPALSYHEEGLDSDKRKSNANIDRLISDLELCTLCTTPTATSNNNVTCCPEEEQQQEESSFDVGIVAQCNESEQCISKADAEADEAELLVDTDEELEADLTDLTKNPRLQTLKRFRDLCSPTAPTTAPKAALKRFRDLCSPTTATTTTTTTTTTATTTPKAVPKSSSIIDLLCSPLSGESEDVGESVRSEDRSDDSGDDEDNGSFIADSDEDVSDEDVSDEDGVSEDESVISISTSASASASGDDDGSDSGDTINSSDDTNAGKIHLPPRGKRTQKGKGSKGSKDSKDNTHRCSTPQTHKDKDKSASTTTTPTNASPTPTPTPTPRVMKITNTNRDELATHLFHEYNTTVFGSALPGTCMIN